MKCPQHPRYTGKLRPRVPCYMCWVKYAMENPREKFTSKEMLATGEAAVEFEGNRLSATGMWTPGKPMSRKGKLVMAADPLLGRNGVRSPNGPMKVHTMTNKHENQEGNAVGVGGED